MHRWIARHVCGVAALLVLVGLCLAQEIVATSKHADGVYKCGEMIEWHVAVQGDGAAAVTEAHYVLKQGGLNPIREGTLDLTTGGGDLKSVGRARHNPGRPQREVGRQGIEASGGRGRGPKQNPALDAAARRFRRLLDAKIEELQAVPPNPSVEPVDIGNPAVEYYKVQLDNIRGTHVYGQLAKPKREGKFPAVLVVAWAGVYPLPPGNVVERAEAGWLALNIMAHDLPFDQPQAFYNKVSSTTLKDYPAIGNDDREKSYFLRMYLGCYRAADYLASRPDWDGRTMVVTGSSQGGLQSIIAAGISPKITALMADCPAGCDTTGLAVDRMPGWPYSGGNVANARKPQVAETSRYFDAVNFASRVKCPALVATGLIDVTCPSAGVLAACNQFQGPKEVLLMVNAPHNGGPTHVLYNNASNQWLSEMRKGEPVPPK